MLLLGDGDAVTGVRQQPGTAGGAGSAGGAGGNPQQGAGGQQGAGTPADPDALIDQGLAVYNQGDAYAAYQIWRPLADQGNARAENNIGGLLEMGSGVARDEAAAAWWYGRAAAQGHMMAQFNLARLLMQGQSVPGRDRVVRLLELAAAQDCVAMNELVCIRRLTVRGGPCDSGRLVLARGQARQPFAQVNLARAYEKGGVCCPT